MTLAVATVTLGVMGAFALVLVPAWGAFRVAPSWRWALLLDQPFAPILVALALLPAGLVALIGPRHPP